MRNTCAVLLLSLAAAVAYGQAPETQTPATTKPAATAASGSPASKPSKHATKKPTTKKTSQKSAMASPMAPKKPVAVKAAKPKVAKKPQPEAKPKTEDAGAAAPAATAGSGRRRDPFISPVQARIEGLQSACQGGGPRCLAVNEIVLRGVVRTPTGMVAVVENAAQRTYFLHENTPIYNGFVEKITPDSVVFKEHYLDNLGHDSQREVVKTVNAPVV